MRLFPLFLLSLAMLPAQTLTVFSGNGQIVQEQFLSTSPLTVQARDASARPVSGVNVAWSLTQGSGTITLLAGQTDANGLASTQFLATSLNPGVSFQVETITATSPFGTAVFNLTTSIARLPGGGFAAPPLPELLAPNINNRAVSGSAGAILPAAVVVRVTAQSGSQAGQPVPNVGVRIVSNPDSSQPTASCNAPGGTVLTDATGTATCDLVLGSQIGTTNLTALVGESQNTASFSLTVTPRVPCAYSISPTYQSFGAGAANGSVNITTGTNCAWTATPSDSWIVPGQSVGGGSGLLVYSVAANNGVARTGTLNISGQLLTINQAAASGLLITTPPTLLPASVGAAYSAQLNASGGSGGYQWTLNGTLPPGLSLSPGGLISGTPTGAGSYSFGVSVTAPGINGSAVQTLSIIVLGANGQFAITTTSLPNAPLGLVYQQPLTSTLGCTTPFAPAPVFRLVSGTLPPGLALQAQADRSYAIVGTPTTAGTYPFTLSATDACGVVATASLSISVGSSAGAGLVATPSSLSFTGSGSGFLDLNSATPLPYTATGSTNGGGAWLTVANASGTTPARIAVSVTVGQLGTGVYTGGITIIAGGSTFVVPVSLVVGAASLSAIPSTLSATLSNTGTTTSQQTIALSSTGASIAFNAAAEQSATSVTPWLSVTPATGSVPAALLVTLNAASLTPGNYTGLIRITSPGTQALVIPVQLTVLASATLQVSPASVNFTSMQGGLPPPGQTISVTSSGNGVQFQAVVPSLAGSNWLQVVPASGIAPGSFTITANPAGFAPGTYSGVVSVQSPNPLIPAVTLPVTLTVTAAAAPVISSVTSAASFVPGTVSAGEMVTLFGSQMGPASGVSLILDASGRITSTNSGTRVLFDQIAAPILYTSAGQVSAIAPFELAGRVSTMVQVEYNGVRSNAVNIGVSDATPAIFTLNAAGQAAILNQDGSVNFGTNRASASTIVSIFATGFGQTNPASSNGQISGADLKRVQYPVALQIGAQQAEIQYAGTAPGLPAGMIQINAKVPTGTPPSDRVQVILSVQGVIAPTVYMGVK